MIKPAELMFTFNPGNIVSEGIGWFQTNVEWRGKEVDWSHVQIVSKVYSESLIEVVSAEDFAVIPKNVDLDDHDREGIDYAFLTLPRLTDDNRRGIVRRAWSQLWKKYDTMGLGSFIFGMDMSDPQKWFCSKLAIWAYRAEGFPVVQRVRESRVHPNWLWSAGEMVEVTAR